MKKHIFIALFMFSTFFGSRAQLLYLQETYRGGINADGKSYQGFDCLFGDFITFHNSIPAGSTLKKALLISMTYLFDGSVVPTKINSIHLILNGHNIYPDSSNWVAHYSCGNLSFLYMSVLDVTQYVNPSNNLLVTPNQNPLLSHPDYDYAYNGYLLVMLYEDNTMPVINAAIILNSMTSGNPLYLSINGLNPIDVSKDVGLSIWKPYYIANNDSVKFSVNSNYLGGIFAASQNDGLHLPGSFYYQNNTLFGLDDDTPDAFIDSSDAIANIRTYVANSATSVTVTTSPAYECITNGLLLAYSTPCPAHAFDSTKTFTICAGSTVQLHASPGAGFTYSWFDMTGQIGSPTSANIIVSPTVTTNYVAYVDSAGCRHTEHFKVGVHPNPVTDSIFVSPAICGGSLGIVDTIAEHGGAKPYHFDIGAGGQTSSVFPNLSPGNYTLTVTDNVGCKNEKAFSIMQVNNAVASFSIQATACVNTPMNISNTSTGTNLQWWNIGSDTSTVASPVYSFSDTGSYIVTLIAWNNLPQCSDTASKTVYVKECPPDSFKIVVPNVFSPNGDGINEIWQPLIYQSGYEITSWEIDIYDRWGLKVFTANEVKQGWDGRTTSGNPCQDGTYYYVVSYEASAKEGNKKEALRGFLQIVR